MTSAELKQIVDQPTPDPAIVGRLACNLRADQPLEQNHKDQTQLHVHWQELGGLWRCTITPEGSPSYLARVDLHDGTAVRIEAREPCAITISPDDDLLCMTRYR
jgi:hypothetical protein